MTVHLTVFVAAYTHSSTCISHREAHAPSFGTTRKSLTGWPGSQVLLIAQLFAGRSEIRKCLRTLLRHNQKVAVRVGQAAVVHGGAGGVHVNRKTLLGRRAAKVGTTNCSDVPAHHSYLHHDN